MIKKCFLGIALIGLLLSYTNLNGQQINDDFVEGEIYVKLKANSSKQSLSKKTSSVNIGREIPGLSSKISSQSNQISKAESPFYFSKNEELRRIYRIKLEKNENMDVLLKSIMEDENVEYAERIYRRKIIATPSDTSFASQWHLNKIKATQAWDVNPGGSSVIVAVVDNAIQTDHIDLAANMVAGRDVADNDDDPRPPNLSFSHGTHVAGIVGAVTNNITGIASAGNNKVKIMPVKATGDGSFYNYIDNGFEGISWAVANGADIISLSWGGSGSSQAEQDVINDAWQNGVMVIAAAGNENSDIAQYPASYEHVVSVASLDNDDSRSSFSSYGQFVDISAPGRGIYSTIPFGDYASYNGTSMATPLVSSCAGYLLSCFPSLSPDSIEYILKNTADNIDAQNTANLGEMGAGRVNLLKAVSCKSANLFKEIPEIVGSNFFCEGDSVLLQINPVNSESFNWTLNGNTVSKTASFYAKGEGSYLLKRNLNDCEIVSEPNLLVHNKTLTGSPTVSDLDLIYCSSGAELIATAPLCSSYGPTEFIYSGPMVGFDGYERSGPFPTVEVSGMGGLIDSVSISITWQKKDGGYATNCDEPDGGSTPFNEEIEFQILSPEGILIPLLKEGTYGRGGSVGTSGVVTTVFTFNGTAVANNSLPSSGSFKAAGNLAQLENRISQGTWTLIASDNFLIDPLCVSGFSVTIKSKEPLGSPSVKWYDAPQNGNLLASTTNLSVPTASPGLYKYYVKAQCEGMCPGTATEASVSVRNVPELFAFPRSAIHLTMPQVAEIMNAQMADYSVSNNIYTIFGTNQSGQPFSYQVSDQGPIVSPATLCNSEEFVVFGMNCGGTISWSNGETGMGVRLQNISLPYTLTATCNQNWNCTPLADIPFEFMNQNTALTLQGIIPVNDVQTFYGEPIESIQIIEPSAIINYKAPGSITLNPGFEAKSSSIFKAVIGDCLNN